MSKKHYIALAGIVKRATENGPDTDLLVASELAHDLADYLQEDNPRFDRDRFLDAALPGAPVS